MQTAITYNNVDFEENIYDFFTFMKYKGELFTGTLVDGDSTTEYKNGNADGRSVGYHDNGQIENDYFFFSQFLLFPDPLIRCNLLSN